MAKNKEDFVDRHSPGALAAMTGGSIVGANVARHNIAHAVRAAKESKLDTHDIGHVHKKLQPGDVFFSRSPRKESPAYKDVKEKWRDTPVTGKKWFEKIRKHFPSFREQDLIRMYGGHPLYHAGIYVGDGKVIHAADEARGVVKEDIGKAFEHGSKVHFYRAKGADKKEVESAVNFAHKSVGKPYEGRKWINKEILRELVGRRKPVSGGKVCNQYVCTTLVSNAYPKKFKKHWAQPPEMMSRLEPIAKATKGHAAPISIGQRIPPHVIAPTVRSLKMAVPGAGLAYILSKHRKAKQEEEQAKV